eukprot:UN03771
MCLPQFNPQNMSVGSTMHHYAQLSDETLLYICFRQPGTPSHYFAVLQLKQRGWVYHVQLGTWCYRLHAPELTADRTETTLYMVYDPQTCEFVHGTFHIEF